MKKPVLRFGVGGVSIVSGRGVRFALKKDPIFPNCVNKLNAWTKQDVTMLMADARVVARDGNALPITVPVLGLHTDFASDSWDEQVNQLFVEDRPQVIGAWWTAIARPGEVVEVFAHSKRADEWCRERVRYLNLLAHDDFACVLVIMDTVEKGITAPRVRAAPDRAQVRSPAWILQYLDPVGKVVRTEGNVESIFGRPDRELVGRPVVDFLHPDDLPPAVDMWMHVIAKEANVRTIEQRVIGPDKSMVWILSTVMNRMKTDGFVLSVSHDITAQRESEAALRLSALRDALTGLHNRRSVHELLGQALNNNQQVLVMFGDLNGFKQVNDRWGHRQGDQVLVDIARRLESMALPDEIVGRWGGDEFVFCRIGASPEDAQDIRLRLSRVLAAPILIGDARYQPSLSLGEAWSKVGETADELLDRADFAMYEAKRPA